MSRVLTPPAESWRPQLQNVSMGEQTESLSPGHKMEEEEEVRERYSISSDDFSLYSDEENDTSSPIKPTFSEYDSEEDNYFGKVDPLLWQRYRQQVKDSQGFDIIDYPGQCFMTTVFPMPNYLSSAKNYNKLKDYAGKALEQYNTGNGTCYEVDDVLKVNGGGCRDFIYYITFSVKNGVDRFFQAKVVEDLSHRLKFPIVRPKVGAVME